jgi:transitional endoplasmic reticulum ATPase
MSISINNLYSYKSFIVVIRDAILLPTFMSHERHLRFGGTDMASNIDEDNSVTNSDKDIGGTGRGSPKAISLRVAEAEQRDIGRKIARVDPEIIERLNITSGDALELTSLGKKTTVLSWPARSNDKGKALIRIDGYTRNRLDVGINDQIEVKRVESKDAKSITFAPTEPLRILGAGEYLAEYLNGQLMTKGDMIPLNVMGRRVDLVVISTSPSGPVIVNESTKITVSEESAKAVQVSKESGIPSISYEDIGGLGDAVGRVREMIELPLRHPELFKRLGVEAPKGVLLHGPPGTGKTLLAKAVANESEANFISIKGPELLSKWVGESEKGVREVFRKARQAAPCIIFFDEVDAIAPRRGGSFGDSHVTERLISQLLTELDGLEILTNVIVIAATNRPDIIDPALLRPGRFDRLLYVPPPDRDSRVQIIKIHTKKKPLAEDVNIEQLADHTDGYTGADIASLSSAAVILALREHISKYKDPKEADSHIQELKIHSRHFEEAMKKIRPLSNQELSMYKSISEQFGRPEIAGGERTRKLPEPGLA